MSQYWFISTKYRRNATLALVTFALALIVILLGAYTRLTNAGLSCPDWPNCFGYVVAPHTPSQLQDAATRFPMTIVDVKKARTEMRHRYFAMSEGILIFILSLSILFSRKAKSIKSIVISGGLLALLPVQVLLGKLTVTEKLHPLIVLGHLVTGLSLLGLLWWAYLDLHLRIDAFAKKVSRGILPWLWLGLLVVAAQITLGGWVSTHYAGLACIDFPYCNGQVLPTLHLNEFNTNLITIHMLHRIGAMITGIYLFMLTIAMFRQPSLRALAVLIFILVALQVSLGVLNIIWLRPLWIALTHHAVAILLLLTMITALAKAHVESQEKTWYGNTLA